MGSFIRRGYRILWRLGVSHAVLTQKSDRGFKVFKVLERLVNAGKAQVGYRIQFGERFKDGKSHFVRVNFGESAGPNKLFDFLGEFCQIVFTHRTPLAGFTHTGSNLRTVEWLGHTGAFNNGNSGCFNGCKTPTARGTLAAAADSRAVVGGSRIYYARVCVLAVRAIHGVSSGGHCAAPASSIIILILPMPSREPSEACVHPSHAHDGLTPSFSPPCRSLKS